MWRSHGRAAGIGITTIAGVTSRTRASAWRRDIGLDPPAAVPGDRTPTAKRSYGIGAGIQRASRVRRRIERRWI